MALEAAQTNTNPEIRKVTPRKIIQANAALNGAYSLFLDQLFQGASAFADVYRPFETFGLSQRLFNHWLQNSANLAPGDEYKLVDDFAEMIGLRAWYEWKVDPGHHEVVEPPPKEATTNPELLRQKHPAAVWFLLDALKRYAALDAEQVRAIAFEIAMLGRSGLDYASPEKKYTLRSIPDETFSGLQLMCLMHAGFKRVAPDMDTGIDLEEPWHQALALFQASEPDAD
jgi:hypothetical protein